MVAQTLASALQLRLLTSRYAYVQFPDEGFVAGGPAEDLFGLLVNVAFGFADAAAELSAEDKELSALLHSLHADTMSGVEMTG
jgi:hypothetical protein